MQRRIKFALVCSFTLLAPALACCAESDTPRKDALKIILRGDTDTELAPHGTGNVYAPDVYREWRPLEQHPSR
jgi:hypothetical protein